MVHRQTHNTTRAAGSTRRSVLAASMALPFVAGPAWSASGDYPDRPIRLVVLMMLAFAAGVFFERGHQRELCESSGGVWSRTGICTAGE